jgi:hypothetical protein
LEKTSHRARSQRKKEKEMGNLGSFAVNVKYTVFLPQVNLIKNLYYFFKAFEVRFIYFFPPGYNKALRE